MGDLPATAVRMTENDRSISDLTGERPIVAKAYEYGRGHRIAAHAHAAAQLVYAVSGAMSVSTDQGIWVVPPLRAVWIPPRRLHTVQMHADVSMRTVYVVEEKAGIFERRCCVVSVSGLLRELIVEATRFPETYTLHGRYRLIVELLLGELKTSPQAGLHLAEPGDRRLRRITESLKANPADNRPLRCWAQHANASERTLARLFLKETGLTFAQWRQQARLLHAIAMLAQGIPVTTIAIDLGYSTPSAFGFMFRRALGSAPSAFFCE